MKRKNILIFLGALIVLFLTIGLSYSFYSAKEKFINKSETIIKTNELSLIYTGVKEITTGKNIIPGDSFTKTFTVENTSSVDTTFNIYMENVTNEFNEDLVFVLSDDNGTVATETPLPVTNTNKSYLMTDINIKAGELKTYTLKIEYKYLDTPQNDYQGKYFKGTVGIDTEKVDVTYSMFGTVYKNEDSNKTLVTEGNLVFFSEHQDVAITSEGKFEATNLEMGNHEVYYMGNIDASSMTKEEIKSQALCTSTFKMGTSNNEIFLNCKDANDNYSMEDIEIQEEEKIKYISFTVDDKSYKVEENTTWNDFVNDNGDTFSPSNEVSIYDKSKSNYFLADYNFNTFIESGNKKYRVLVTSIIDWTTLLHESVPSLSKKYPKIGRSSAGISGKEYDSIIKYAGAISYKNNITLLNSNANANNLFALSDIYDESGNVVKVNDVIRAEHYTAEKIENTVLAKANFDLVKAYNGYSEYYYDCEYVVTFNTNGPTSGDIYYSDTITYENGNYALVNPKLFTIGTDTTTLVGKFSTFNNTSTTGSNLFKIGSVKEDGSVGEFYVIVGGMC